MLRGSLHTKEYKKSNTFLKVASVDCVEYAQTNYFICTKSMPGNKLKSLLQLGKHVSSLHEGNMIQKRNVADGEHDTEVSLR